MTKNKVFTWIGRDSVWIIVAKANTNWSNAFVLASSNALSACFLVLLSSVSNCVTRETNGSISTHNEVWTISFDKKKKIIKNLNWWFL